MFKTERKVQCRQCCAGGRVDKGSLVIVGRNLDFILRVLGSHDGTKRRDSMARCYRVQ